MKKRTLAILLILTLLRGLFPMSVLATEAVSEEVNQIAPPTAEEMISVVEETPAEPEPEQGLESTEASPSQEDPTFNAEEDIPQDVLASEPEPDTLEEVAGGSTEETCETFLYYAPASGKCGDNVTWSFSGRTLTISGQGDMCDYSGYDDSNRDWPDFLVENVVIHSGVTSIGKGAFRECVRLSSISIPNSVVSIGPSAFSGCISLETITIPNSVTEIGSYAFTGCKNLTAITIPGSVKVISRSMFSYCEKLSSITLSEGVTTIEDYAFRSCENIGMIYFPGTLTTISDYAFYQSWFSSGLAEIHYGGGWKDWLNISIGSYNGALTWPIYYYDSLSNVTITSTNAHKTGNILYWDAVPGAELYQIFRRTSGQPFSYLRCARGLGVKDTTAKMGVTYIYAVRAVDGDRRSMNYSNQVTLTRPISPPGWQQSGSTWQYLVNGNPVTRWKQIDGAWYYFNASGEMQTGWLNDGGTWYYLYGSGSMATGWVSVDGTWYYMNGSGEMQTGWLNSGGTWYYLYDGGSMATGWVSVNGTWYYMNSSGAMQTGWLNDSGTWYYLDASGAWVA